MKDSEQKDILVAKEDKFSLKYFSIFYLEKERCKRFLTVVGSFTYA